MAITGAVGAALRQDAPFQAEIQMGAQLIMDFQGARSGRRPYYWYRGTRYTRLEKIPGWSFSRASVGYAEDSAGNLISFPANGPRVTDRGLLIEEARTNKVQVYNANPTALANVSKLGDAAATLTLVNDAAAVAAGGLSGVVTGGQVYKLDNSAGTSNALAAVTGQTSNLNVHTLSAYMRGSGQVRLRTGTANTGFINLASGYARSAQTVTPGVTTDQLEIWASAGAVVYFILPQLEEGSFVTSPIITTGAAATRAMDSAYISGLGVILTRPFSMVAHADMPAADGANRWLAQVDDGTSTGNRYQLSRAQSNALAVGANVAGSTVTGALFANGQTGAIAPRMAVRARSGSYSGAINGERGDEVAIADPEGISRLVLGGNGGTQAQLNGYLRRVVIFGDLSGTQLTRLTA